MITTAAHGSVAAELARQTVRLGLLTPHLPEQTGRHVDNPRNGDLAVVDFRGRLRFAVVSRVTPTIVHAAHITAGSVARAAIRAGHVTGTPMDPRTSGYAERLAQNAVDHMPPDSPATRIAEAYRDAYRAADIDMVTAHACQNAGLKWFTCWASVTVARVRRANLRVVRDNV